MCVEREREKAKRERCRKTQNETSRQRVGGKRGRGGERERERKREIEKREKRQRVEIEGSIDGEPLPVAISDKTAQEALYYSISLLSYSCRPQRASERASACGLGVGLMVFVASFDECVCSHLVSTDLEITWVH
jgi:hypothetical protein